ncbi:MAG: alpha/beta hydrolase, partial [Gemmatimonadetes bacterium]|nr:alpha/beta hydrolase [Gemmatimonadota bacterium]
YRGYGGSGGKPSEEGFQLDAQAGWRFLMEQVGNHNRIVLFGRSMGGGVAARLAATHRPGALVLESAFTSLAEIGKSVYPFLPRFLLLRLETAFATRQWVQDTDAPLLVIHGTEDQLVPLAMGREIFEAGGGPKEWYGVRGAGHNDVFWVGGGEYFGRIAEFVGRQAG